MSQRPDFENMTQPQLVDWLRGQNEAPRGNISKANALDWALRKWKEVAFNGADPAAFDHDHKDGAGGSLPADEAQAQAEAAGPADEGQGDASEELEEVVAGEDDEAAPTEEAAADEAQAEEPAPEPEAPEFPVPRPEGLDDGEWDQILAAWAEEREDCRELFVDMIVAGAAYKRRKAIVPPAPQPAPPGMVSLFAPPGVASASYGGATYAVKEGVVIVPFGAIHALQAHGFSTTPQ